MMEQIEIFIPCAVDQFRPSIGLGMAKALEAAGLKVTFRREQGCCGAISFQAGHWDEARELGISLLNTFKGAKKIVTPSADCAIMVTKHYHELFFNTAFHLEFRGVSEALFEFCDYWVNELGNPDLGLRFEATAVMHPSCGLGNEYMQGRELELLLQNIKGLQVVDLPNSYHSCGHGGLLSWNYPEVSVGIGTRFLEEVSMTRAQVLIVNEPACALNLQHLISRHNMALKVLHVTELISLALEGKTSLL